MRLIAPALLILIAASVVPIASVWPENTANDMREIDRLGVRMAMDAMRNHNPMCADSDRCDQGTGCISPSPAPGPITEVPSEDEAHRHYVRDLKAFHICRQRVQRSRLVDWSHIQFVGAASLDPQSVSFADSINRWNGNYLWEPASASTDIITKLGDEARAVFGPIPDADCGDAAARIIPLEIDGNIVDLKRDPTKTGSPLQFEHRDIADNIVGWTSEVARCDKPSLAGNVTYCGMNSRVSRRVTGNVEWVALCRKSSPHLELDPEPYWQKDNPAFARLGIIGFNRLSGEIVFFDGSKERAGFDWTQTFVPPGGHSYADRNGRAAAAALYDPTFQVQCSACHDNKSPYVIDPHIGQARVGYSNGARGREAGAFSLGDYIPKTPHTEQLPFRVVGSAYTATYGNDLARARTIRDPSGNCTECHTLTTQVTGQRLAADAAGREPTITKPDWAQLLKVRAERLKLDQINLHRTEWALRSGAGKIHPWMVPQDGSNVAAMGPEIGDDDWQQLSNCIWEAGGQSCGYRPLYSTCRAPGQQPDGDGSAPIDATATVLAPPPGETGADRLLRLNWKYLNDYGGVPQRDDVRFNLAIRSTPIPSSRKPPEENDYPDIADARDAGFASIAGDVGTSGAAMLIRDISYFGHRHFTEPTPSTVPRTFRIDLPAQCNRRYLASILPKRFCFDQAGTRYADRALLIYADITCN